MLKKKNFLSAAVLFGAFIVFTLLVRLVDVKPIGPEGSEVGFAALNGFFLSRLSFSKFWFGLADLLGYLALLIVAVFGLTGLQQLIRRKSLFRVDIGILLLGVFYIVVLLFYVLFDKLAVNLRPVLMDGELESSYPSSHTVLAFCVMISALPRLKSLPFFRPEWMDKARLIAYALAALTVLTRFLSGAHWFTDILGGVLLSAALLSSYFAADKLLAAAPGKHEKN